MKDAGLRGWDLAIWGLIVFGVIFLWRIMPRLIKKESKGVVAAITKGEFDGLARENGLLMDGNGAVIRRLENIESSLIELKSNLADAKHEREWYNNTNAERFAAMSGTIQGLQARLAEASQYSLMAVIYSNNIQPLIRMTVLKQYLKNGWNGDCVEFAIADLLLPHRKLWHSLFVKPEDLSDVANKELYLETLKKINDRIHAMRREPC
jgi:hypothetical protein